MFLKIVFISIIITFSSSFRVAYSKSLSDLIPPETKQCRVIIKPNIQQASVPIYFVITIANNGRVGFYTESKRNLEHVQVVTGEKRQAFHSIEADSIKTLKSNKKWGALFKHKPLYLTGKLDKDIYTSSTYNNLKSKHILKKLKSHCAEIVKNRSEYLIAPQYESATGFYNGVAVVKKNGLWGLINKKNKWVVKPQYDDVGTYNEGYIGVMKKKSGKKLWGLINYRGELFHSIKYQRMEKCSQNRCAIKIADKWGYVSPEGGIVISARLDLVRDFREDYTAVKFKKKWYLINRSGKALYSYDDAIIYSPSDGLFAAKERGRNGKRGFVNLKGKVVIPAIFDRVKRFSEGFAAVRNKEKKWGYISKSGFLQIPYKYKGAKLFKDGLAPVKNTKGKWGYINKEGKWIIRPKFKHAFPFKNGIATIRVDNPKDKKNPFRGFINLKGEFIYEPIFEDVYNFSEGTAPVKVSGKWGFIKKPDVK